MLDLGLDAAAETVASSGPLEIVSSRMPGICGRRCAAPTTGSGSPTATGGDEVFRQLVLARIIEPTSKLDSLRVLAEAGVHPPAYRTLKRRLRVLRRADLAATVGGGVREARRAGAGVPGPV